MDRILLILIGVGIVLIAAVAGADTLMLKDGRVLTGAYVRGTASAI